MKGYRDLVVWQRAMDLVPAVYAVARALPKEETYALGDQLRRAVVSIPANIAEGQARQHRKEFLQYLAIAKGSLAELTTLLLVVERIGYMSAETLAPARIALSRVASPLHGLITTLRHRTPEPQNPKTQKTQKTHKNLE
ncbi:four helix bundle protein [Luteimonas cucumeris]|uniref:four helix bundle protein n=1 Tax=Luteimonas cucumeris TaxID=985012 RepID=UPI001A7E2DEE|nr:four helix bundle protein [Luteimonas cucumeris]